MIEAIIAILFIFFLPIIINKIGSISKYVDIKSFNPFVLPSVEGKSVSIKDKSTDLNIKIEKIQSTSLSFDTKRELISLSCANDDFDLYNPLIDRYAIDLKNSHGDSLQDKILTLINEVKSKSGLMNIYGGYVELKEPINSHTSIGYTSLEGMNINMIIDSLSSGNNIVLCYIAIPIDEEDFIIENQSMTDWNFQETILDPIIGVTSVPVGAITSKNIEGRLRTLKFISDV